MRKYSVSKSDINALIFLSQVRIGDTYSHRDLQAPNRRWSLVVHNVASTKRHRQSSSETGHWSSFSSNGGRASGNYVR